MKGGNMKKIIGIVIASLVFCNIGFAEIKMIESEIIGAARVERYQLSTVCVDGYKFVVAKSGEVHSMSMVQFMREGGANEKYKKAVPAKC